MFNFNNEKNTFDSALDWTIEQAFRDGLELAMKKVKLKELIAEKASKILSDDAFIHKLAEEKVKKSLGL